MACSLEFEWLVVSTTNGLGANGHIVARIFRRVPRMSGAGELSISGQVLRSGEEGWDAARAAWNLAADQHPALVAIVQDVHDVAAVVRWAAANELRVTAQ